MKYLKRFNESMVSMEESSYFTNQDLEKLFDITILDIQDIVQDVLDESEYLSCNVHIWNQTEFVIKFFIKAQFGEDAKNWLFERGLVIKHLEELKTNLAHYGLEIFYISNAEYPDDDKTFGVNLFVRKRQNTILEANKTESHEEKLLVKYFDLTSEDIKDWVQDFLDEYHDLDFEVSVVNQNLFMINFFEVDALFQGNITKEKYPYPEDLLQFLKDRLKAYDCYIVPEPGSKGDVYYAISKQYMSLRIVKKSWN